MPGGGGVTLNPKPSNRLLSSALRHGEDLPLKRNIEI